MRLLSLVLVTALVCAALAQEEAPARGRGRARLISRQRLADVIDGAVVEEGTSGRKRVLVRRPGSARRRVKVIRRPRPSSTTAAPEPTEPAPTEPPVTTFAPSLAAVFATSAPPAFREPEPAFQAEPVAFRPKPVAFRPEPAQELFDEPAPARSARQRIAPRRPAAPSVAAPTTAPRRQRPAEATSSSGSRQLNRKEEVVGTIKNYSYYNEDGSFTFGYEAEDGSFKEETRGVDCVVRGKYGYIDPDGVKREFTYESGNPCDETAAEEEAQFDEQGFPILDESGRLEGGVDPLDDQPIRRPTNQQFISQTKEEPLGEEELRQFRVSRRRRPDSSRRLPAPRQPEPEPAREPEPALEPEPVTFRPRPAFTRQPEPVTFRPRPSFIRQPEPEPETVRPVLTSPAPSPRPAVTFRQPEQPSPRPQPAFTFQQPRPSPIPVRPVSSGVFDFDQALRDIQTKPTSAPAPAPLDADDADFSLSRPTGIVGANFDHQLVFDPNSGKHRTDLVQKLPTGTEIRIGENINSFGRGPTTTTPRPTPPPFQNNVFQSFSARPPPPPSPPTTRPTTTRPPPPPPPPSVRPFTTFGGPQPPQFRPPQSRPPPPPQQPRQPFSVFSNQPRPPPPQQQRPPFTVFNNRPVLAPRPPPTAAARPSPLPTPSAGPASSASGPRPVQQVSFGTQVQNPVFARFGVPQPFQPFGGAPQQAGQFRAPQPINFFGQN